MSGHSLHYLRTADGKPTDLRHLLMSRKWRLLLPSSRIGQRREH
jgi:hypothetical protein